MFVCTGNSCRSIMAEALLKKILNDKGRDDVEVSSAGTSAIGGSAPTDNTIKVLREEGIDVSGYKTTKLTPDAIRKTDLILTMDKPHIDKVLTYVPEAGYKTYLLRRYVNKGNRSLSDNYSIPDPIGKPMEVYERVFSMIKECIKELVERL